MFGKNICKILGTHFWFEFLERFLQYLFDIIFGRVYLEHLLNVFLGRVQIVFYFEKFRRNGRMK